MRRIVAIARLAISNALRSRVVLSLAVVLLLVIFALPLTIKSDGTLEGHVHIVLNYTLGLAFIILAVATLWTGCSAIAVEIEEKQAHLLVTKPVHRIQIWLGKWLGLICLDAVLLSLCASVIYGLLLWTTRPAVTSAADQARLRDEVLVARQEVGPELGHLDGLVEERAAEARASGRVPADMQDDAVREAVREGLLHQQFSVGPGESKAWTYNVHVPSDTEQSLLLRFKFSASIPGPIPVTGRWRVGTPGHEKAYQHEDSFTGNQRYALPVPSSAVTGSEVVTVRFTNINDANVTVIFDVEDGLSLSTYAGRFEGNLVRTLLMLFARLALLAALGLTAGALFSTPIAVFVSFSTLVVMHLAHYLQGAGGGPAGAPHGHEHGASLHMGFLDRVSDLTAGGIHAVLGPLKDPDILALLGAGQAVPWSLVGLSLFLKLFVYCGALALLATWVLNRREIGLPS